MLPRLFVQRDSIQYEEARYSIHIHKPPHPVPLRVITTVEPARKFKKNLGHLELNERTVLFHGGKNIVMTETLQRKNTSIETSVNSVTTEIIESCLDAKAFDVLVLNVKKLSDIADNFVIVSGRSDRHVQGIVNRVLHDMTEKHVQVQSIEGYEHGHWVILDCGDIVLHVFYEPERETYDLEGLWSRAPRLAVERHSQSGAVELRAA